MKKLKIILWFSYFLIILYTIFSLLKKECVIQEEPGIAKGTIIEYQHTENYIKFVIQGTEKIVGYYYGKAEESFQLGEEVILKGTIKSPEENRNFFLFNYKNYLKSQKIHKVMNIDEIIRIKRPISFYYKLKNAFLNRLKNFERTKQYMLLFLYGENNLEENLKDQYRKIGIQHLFAISGMHILFFKAILEKILKKWKKKDTIIIFFLFFYLFLVKMSPSILRVILTENIYLLSKRKIHKKEILNFVFFFLLLMNPFYIYHIGFQFSFIISYAFMTIKFKVKNKVLNSLIKSSIAFFVTIPILINQNFELNFLTPLYNIFFIPYVSIFLFPLVILTFFFPIIEPLLEKNILFLEYFTNVLSQIDFATISFGYLTIFSFCLLYLFIILGLKNRKYILLLGIFLIFHYFKASLIREDNIIMLDVGQGDSILIQSTFNILIDTGGAKNKNIAEDTILPVLKARGIHKVDLLILTHGDYDHMGETINLVNNFKVENVIFNCGEYNDLEKELINVLEKKNIKYYSCIEGLNIDDNKLYFLQTKEYDNENDNSNVIYMEIDGYKFMFMGDAGVDKEKDILDKYNISNIDVLKVGHHGSKTSSSKDFIEEIDPEYSIISVGNNNRYGHPNKEVLNNLESSKIYRTDQDGSIMFKIKNNKLKIETCSP